MTEFWDDAATNASWTKLQQLPREIDFVLIGGWAVYLYTRLQKSRDIDIIVDYRALRLLEGAYDLTKNDRLKKYEIKQQLFDIDIYLPRYSKLALPVSDIMDGLTTSLDGFTVPKPEAMITLKLGAAADRGGSAKGMKDAIDILGLLFYSGLELDTLNKLLERYKLAGHMKLLRSILEEFDLRNLKYLNLNEKSFSKLKGEYLARIKSL